MSRTLKPRTIISTRKTMLDLVAEQATNDIQYHEDLRILKCLDAIVEGRGKFCLKCDYWNEFATDEDDGEYICYECRNPNKNN